MNLSEQDLTAVSDILMGDNEELLHNLSVQKCMEYADYLLEVDQTENALVFVSKAVVKQPDESELHQRKAQYLVALGRTSEALVTMQRYMKQHPENQNAILFYAKILMQLGKSQKLLEMVNNTVLDDATRFLCLVAAGKKEEALGFFVEKLEGQNSISILYQRAKLLAVSAGMEPLAIDSISKLILELNPLEQKEALVYLAFALYQNGQYQMAYEGACLLAQENNSTLCALGLLLKVASCLKQEERIETEGVLNEALMLLYLFADANDGGVDKYIIRALLNDLAGEPQRRDNDLTFATQMNEKDSRVAFIRDRILRKESEIETFELNDLMMQIAIPLWRGIRCPAN